MVIAQAELEGLLFGGVVERERPRLGLAVVVSHQRLHDDRAVAVGVEHTPASFRGAAGGDAVVGAVARAVAGGDRVEHGLLPSSSRRRGRLV
jgi:hypothetical protein